MELVFAILVGFIIFAILRIVERYFPSLYFTFSDLVLGKFGSKDLFVSMILPLLSSFVFGIFVKSEDPWIYALPGFIAALLVVWPNFRVPELLPEELQAKTQSVFVSYALFIVLFSVFSFIGGTIAQPLSWPAILPSWQGVKDEVWGSLIVGGVLSFIRWLNNRQLKY